MIRRLRTDDSGMTLIELLVASLLLGFVLLAVGGVYISTIRTERHVDAVTTAATAAQSAATAVETSVRLATEVHLGGTGNRLAVARVPGSGSTVTFNCVAWYYDNTGDGALWMRSFPDDTAVATPSTEQLTDWTRLVAGIRPSAGPTIFGFDGKRELTMSFLATAGEHLPVSIDLTVMPLTSSELETDRCS